MTQFNLTQPNLTLTFTIKTCIRLKKPINEASWIQAEKKEFHTFASECPR